ncbi:unnamed protein product, partial [Porites evermanni]
MFISLPSVKFLDIISYISHWTSYDKRVKTYNALLSKAWFPYECFDTAEKLDFLGLLQQEEWISKLKNSMTLTKRVQGLQLICWVKGIQNFADLLHFYSNLDLEPFLEALETTQDFYTGWEIDLFKDRVSLLGVSMKYLLHSTLNKRNAPGVVCRREGAVVGRPSLAFYRKHEAGKTRIHSHKFQDAEVCQKVLGYDANALYLSTM